MRRESSSFHSSRARGFARYLVLRRHTRFASGRGSALMTASSSQAACSNITRFARPVSRGSCRSHSAIAIRPVLRHSPRTRLTCILSGTLRRRFLPWQKGVSEYSLSCLRTVSGRPCRGPDLARAVTVGLNVSEDSLKLKLPQKNQAAFENYVDHVLR
jgi:hypothetical protein